MRRKKKEEWLLSQREKEKEDSNADVIIKMYPVCDVLFDGLRLKSYVEIFSDQNVWEGGGVGGYGREWEVKG